MLKNDLFPLVLGLAVTAFVYVFVFRRVGSVEQRMFQTWLLVTIIILGSWLSRSVFGRR